MPRRTAVVEFIGTFFLMIAIAFVVSGPVAESVGVLGPFVFSGVLIAMIYAGGHVSGAHYNPAVSLAFLLHGELERRELVPYLVAQLTAAAAAVYTARLIAGGAAPAPLAIEPLPGLLAEFVFTFALVYVILNVATARLLEDNQFYGVAIGAVVLGGAYAVGPVSAAAFNPAVAVGLAIAGVVDWADLWIHGLAELAAAVAAARVFGWIER